MGKNLMKVVISGVNLVEGGPLKVFKEAIKAFSLNKEYEVICLVNDKLLFSEFSNKNIQFLEFPQIKASWFKRLYFEYWQCKKLSLSLKAEIWLAMHDMSPNILYGKQFVYCHNPSPFYTSNLNDFKFDYKFTLFTLFYKWLYKINIKKNTAVIAQQQWIADFFTTKLSARSTIVAKPSEAMSIKDIADSGFVKLNNDTVTFFYPALARTFKNFELLLNAFDFIEKNDSPIYGKIELILTLDKNGSRYEKSLYNKYSHLKQVKFVGRLSKEEVENYYINSDVVAFPSKLETWGLPITEAKSFKKPILLADIPYAYETLGDYDSVKFIDVNDYSALAGTIKNIVLDKNVFGSSEFKESESICNTWPELINKIVSLS